MAVATYTKSGTKATTPAKLDKAVFGLEVKDHNLLKEAYLAYLAAGRTNNAIAKRRGEVRGGGRKPWRQKGTGNARVGSIRTPLWRGGGAIFGPTGEENYNRRLSVASKRKAIRQALSLAASQNRIKVIETFACPDGKAKPTVQLLSKIDAQGTILIVVPHKDKLVDRATRNLPNTKAVQAGYLNVFDVMNADTVLISKDSLEAIMARLSGGSK
ncbi:MAG TPA: 50S ribosomal protein L4 [Candidatus Saccharimonadales bacterium]|nr:50S ribosomal protein L4 [Candidatus Saccharimonadales bacterium]